MTTTTRTGCALLALAITAGVTACTPAGGPTATSATTPAASTSTSSTTTATTATPSLEQQDVTAAKNAVVKLWAVVDRLTNDPRAPIQDLDPVASGQVLTMFQVNLTTYRAQGWTGSGSAIVEDLTAIVAQSNAQDRMAWTVTACIDRSNTTLVDQSGKSVQMPPYRITHRSTVVKIADRYEVDRDEAVGTC